MNSIDHLVTLFIFVTLFVQENPVHNSSNVDSSHWQLLATQIEQNYYKYDGFVVLSGTDTLAYTASALSFMLENLNKTVVINDFKLLSVLCTFLIL